MSELQGLEQRLREKLAAAEQGRQVRQNTSTRAWASSSSGTRPTAWRPTA
jgi:hypothetical protein